MKKILNNLPLDLQCYLSKIYALTFRPKYYRWLKNLRHENGSNGYSLRPFLKDRCIFIHIPRCAGVSICKSLFGGLAGGHLTIRDYQVAFSVNEFKKFFKFTVVRNPWERIVSAFFFLKGGGMNDRDRMWAEKNLAQFNDFNVFVREWLNEETLMSYYHFRPQTHFFCVGKTPLVDLIIRYENLSHDFGLVSKKIGRQVVLKRINKSNHLDYRRIYDDLSVEKIANLYSLDIELLGYTFDV